jgi:hypothetical protein
MLLASVILVLSGVAMGARAMLTAGVPGDAAAHARNPAAVPVESKSAGTRVASHQLTLRPGGFDPAEVRWPKGKFFLAINNRSGVDHLTLRLDREAGGRVKEIKLRMRKERSAGVLDLNPGDYLLTEANHPGWVCRIKITPQ